jgi:tRNA(adenine34) deaminase
MGKTVDFMREAMKCAVRAARHDDVPIGAIIVKNGKIIARAENRVQKNQDPTNHAEMIAIRSAAKKLEKKFLDGCEIYVTLEPCAMCATAISFARIKKVIYAADDPKGGGINYGAKVYETDGHLFRPEIGKDSVYSDTSSKMLKDFFKKLRVKNVKKVVAIEKKKTEQIAKDRAKNIKRTIKKGKKK